jgi:vitamin B12 transporter
VLACALAHAATAVAQNATSELPEVVVTATRTHTRVQDVTNSITVITGDDIEQRDQVTTGNAMRGSPGMDIVQFGSLGSSVFASIRGSAPDQVLVLLDGVEVNAPTTGQFDFANLTTDNLDRIEVLRGAGGTLYGADAIGGVVNAITRRGEGPLHVSLSAEAGNAATQHEVLSINGSRGPLALSGTVAYLASDGFQPVNNDYSNFSTVWRADADLLPRGTARAFVRYTNARAGLPNFNVAQGRLDPDAYTRTDFILAKGEWEHTLSNGLHYRASAAFVRNDQRFRDNTTDPDEPADVEPVAVAKFPSELIIADTQCDYLWRDLALTTVGVEFKESSVRVSNSQSEQEDGEQELEMEQFNANRSNVGVYGQEQLRFLDQTLFAVAGVRYDYYDDFGDQVTASASGLYLIRPTRTRLRLGYAQGFRVPSFDELFEPNLGNPNLQPERSWEVDAGFTQEFWDGRLHFEPTYFYRNVTNLIEEVADQLPGPIGGLPDEDEMEMPLTRNLDARFQGVELIARAAPASWLSLSVNYTYLNAVTPTGTLLNRPRHRGAFFASTVRRDLFTAGDEGTLSAIVYAVGKRDSPDPQDDFEAAELSGYSRTDLALSYGFAGRLAPLRVHASVRNLFNRNYDESIDFPAPPANFLIGLSYRL